MTSSDSLVDPELAPLIGFFQPMAAATDIAVIREMMAQLAAATPAAKVPGVIMENFVAPGPSGAPPVRVLAYRPAGAAESLPAILHLHGGGYISGTPEMHDLANRLLATTLGCTIFAVDYRLAPETPHPGPLQDCYAALQWLRQNARRLGVDDARIGVKGESAGGGLAAALAIMARDNGIGFAFQHLIYPMLDDRVCDIADPHPYTGEFVWTPALNRLGWSALLGAVPGGTAVSSYAAAARETNLAGLPPAFISVGALDLFLEENMEYARRLSRAGVPVELHVYPGAFHGFDLASEATVAQAAGRDSQAALRRGLRLAPEKR